MLSYEQHGPAGQAVFGVPPLQLSWDCGPFIIVHHHRKAKKLKKLREIRRRKMQMQREHERLSAEEQRKEALDQVNRSMLREEEQWNTVKSLIPSDGSLEQPSLDEEVARENRIKTLCWEVLYILPAVQPTSIFSNQFCKFEYGC